MYRHPFPSADVPFTNLHPSCYVRSVTDKVRASTFMIKNITLATAGQVFFTLYPIATQKRPHPRQLQMQL